MVLPASSSVDTLARHARRRRCRYASIPCCWACPPPSLLPLRRPNRPRRPRLKNHPPKSVRSNPRLLSRVPRVLPHRHRHRHRQPSPWPATCVRSRPRWVARRLRSLRSLLSPPPEKRSLPSRPRRPLSGQRRRIRQRQEHVPPLLPPSLPPLLRRRVPRTLLSPLLPQRCQRRPCPRERPWRRLPSRRRAPLRSPSLRLRLWPPRLPCRLRASRQRHQHLAPPPRRLCRLRQAPPRRLKPRSALLPFQPPPLL